MKRLNTRQGLTMVQKDVKEATAAGGAKGKKGAAKTAQPKKNASTAAKKGANKSQAPKG